MRTTGASDRKARRSAGGGSPRFREMHHVFTFIYGRGRMLFGHAIEGDVVWDCGLASFVVGEVYVFKARTR